MLDKEIEQIDLRAHSDDLARIGLGDQRNTVLFEEAFQAGEGGGGGDLLEVALGAEVQHTRGDGVRRFYSPGSEVGEHVAEGEETGGPVKRNKLERTPRQVLLVW